jgi:drug/metabolite transporter (DMT)-like permease
VHKDKTIAIAFGAIYLIWGSTYLAIQVGLETIPPLALTGLRFLIAGVIAYALARVGGAPTPGREETLRAAGTGLLFFVGGNGGVVWAQSLGLRSSGAALIVGVTPALVSLMAWQLRGGPRPTLKTSLGMLLGFSGVLALVAPVGSFGVVRLVPAVACFLASCCWSVGTVYTKGKLPPTSRLAFVAMQMLAGGAALCISGLLIGDPSLFDLTHITLHSAGALAYLVVFGSIAAGLAYAYLLDHVPAATVATYAYVNPVVAVFLGWALAGEPVGLSTIGALLLILASVALVTR